MRDGRSSVSSPSGSARSSARRGSSASRRRRRASSSSAIPETAPRVRVARNGVDPYLSPGPWPPGAEAEKTRRQHAGGERFLLYLGTLEPRKNVESLVLACERLWGTRRSRPDLVLAGGVGWKSAPLLRRIGRSPYRDKIHLVGYASREIAADLYRAAEAFVYPSLAEGFGLPPSWRRWPAAPRSSLSTADALVEVCGDAALYAPARDVAELARQIERALEDPETRTPSRGGTGSRGALHLGGRGAPDARRARRGGPGGTPMSRPVRASESTRGSSRTTASAPTSGSCSRRSAGGPSPRDTASSCT